MRVRLPTVVDWLWPVVFVLALATSSRPLTGDGAEYVLVAQRLADLSGPLLPLDDARRAGVFDAELAVGEGRQLSPHFPFFPLLAAPVVAVTNHLRASPILAFGIVNAALLWMALVAARRRFGTLAALFLGTSPIIWWIDKAQVEVFTFSCILLGVTFLRKAPVAACCFAMASVQNPPIGGMVILLAVYAAYRGGIRAATSWTWGIAFAILAVHPLYYFFEIGRLTPLVASGDVRLPGPRALFTPLIDLNVGLLVDAPVIGGLMAACLWTGIRRPAYRRAALGVLIVYALFLCAFAQAPNVNSGGTPSLSRYALWLIPPVAALLPGARSRTGLAAALPALVGLSAIWTAVYFRPSIPESYLEPTRTALTVWSAHPSWENPLPEIFAERLRHRDGANTLAATPNCAKVLIQDGVWPQPCTAPSVSATACDGEGALCYANRRDDGTYAFVPTSRRGGISISRLMASGH